MRRGFQSIHHRLFFLFLFCMSGILIIISLLFYSRTTEQFQTKISDLSRKNVSQTVDLFDLLLRGYDSLSKTIGNNFDLVRLLTESPQEPALDYINTRSVTNMIGAIFYSREDLIGIHVIMDKGKIYNYGNYMNVVDPEYRRADWYRDVRQSSGKMVWLGVFPHSLIDQNEKRTVFAFGRQIYDLNEHKPIGIVLYEANPQAILSALNNLKLSEHSEVYLVSDKGRFVSSTASAEALPSLQDIPLPDDSQEMTVDQKNGRLAVASKLPFADWLVVSLTPYKDLTVELVQMQRYIILIGTILVLVSAFIASIVSKRISMPLIRLIRQMKQVEQGNFKGIVNVTSYREINILVGSFNHMVNRIEELIERVKISSVSEKNAELHALQSQVNPHFLYNTLDMIYWMMDEKGNDKLGEVVLSLSHMFRYSSQWEEGAEVTLREEFGQIHHYLTIILVRLEGRLEVELKTDERYMDIRIPKMTLQPIIENAVKHGLEPLLNRPGMLTISTVADSRELAIRIEDNGVGIEEEKLRRLLESLYGACTAGGRRSGGGAPDAAHGPDVPGAGGGAPRTDAAVAAGEPGAREVAGAGGAAANVAAGGPGDGGASASGAGAPGADAAVPGAVAVPSSGASAGTGDVSASGTLSGAGTGPAQAYAYGGIPALGTEPWFPSRQVAAGSEEEASSRGGIGLQNLHRRVQHMYGEAYGVTVESLAGEGTTVIVRVPLPKEESNV
ncbi:histidine kinase [Paenibacillus sp. GbtcB18]|uniref:histidine kinase n=1 Tax=Paenibacillus sp. GbtcB18 TaxID=2824763 RepID=UPI001C2F8A94|nr:histidine kinase [Paenibacillus sp. GbtcB18]